MKKLLFIPIILFAVACQNQPKPETEEIVVEGPVMAYFGSEITEDGAVSVAMLTETMNGADSANVKISGTIEEICQAKGCWMTMKNGEGNMRVTFRDYGFFVPKDASGKEVIAEGTVYMDTTSVADLQHYAEDAGKSEDEIAMITEPEVSLVFVADGVIIKDYKAAEAETEEGHQDHDHSEGDDHGHSH